MSSAFSTAAPAAPRTVLWPRATNFQSRTGHGRRRPTETVSVALEKQPSFVDLRAAFEGFTGAPQRLGLPSAPERPVLYLDQPNRPQPRFDAGRGRGMTVSVGRLRPCSVLDWKFVALGHNTVRGAAGAAVLNAELMQAEGLLD